MSGISADASVFYPKYDRDFPERENPEVVQLRKELSKVRQQLTARDASMRKMAKELSQVEATNLEIQVRSDWLEGRKDKFKKKAENTEEENKNLREAFNELTTENQSLCCSLEKKNVN